MSTDKPAGPFYKLSVDETLTSTNSSSEGISSAEAASRLQQYGENALPQKPGKPAWLRFLAHFNDVLIYVLLAAALLTAVMGHWVDTLVILGVAVINALIGHIQESNAEKSLQSIRNMLSSEAVVIRQGNHETVPTTALVPGDIVVIRAGDRIPADLRVIEAHNLRVEEAILTGESTVVEKNTEALSGDLPLGDRTNLLFSGTTVSSGGGKGLVVATGGDTELGHINQMMADIEKHRTPLLVQIFLIYYGPGQFPSLQNYPVLWHLISEPWLCAMIALSLNSAAYTTQLFYGAIRAIPDGQWQSCSALGMSKKDTLAILLPYAFKRALSSYSNEVVLVFKSTSLAYTITLMEVMGHGQLLYGRTYDVMVFGAAGIVYLIVNGLLTLLMRLVERKALAFERRN